MAIQNTQNVQGDSSFEGSQPTAMSSGGITDSLFEVLWRGRWFVLGAIVLTLAAGFIYILHATPIFESTSRIYVEQSGPKIIDNLQGVMMQSKNYLFTQAELLISTPILSTVVDRPEVRNMATFARTDNPIGHLKRAVIVSVGRKDDIISVTMESPYPAEAAQIVNAIVEGYITYHNARQKGTSLEILKILQAQKQRAEEELDTKRQNLLAFQQEYPSLTFETRQGNIILERLGRLSEALTTAELRTVEVNSHHESIKAYMSDPAQLRQFIEAQRTVTAGYSGSSAEAGRLLSQIRELAMQVEQLQKQQQLTEDHPSIAGLKLRVEMLRSQLTELDNQYADAIMAVARQNLLAAQENEKQIRQYFEQQRTEALALSEISTKYAILKSDIDRSERLCDILNDRIKEINVTEDVGALNISILEVARATADPSKPQKPRILAMALVLGIMLGGGLALVRDWMDLRLRSADEISAVLGVPVLGTVPSMPKRQSITDRGMIVHSKSTSPVSEAYRTLRTAIFFGVPNGKAKTILITSPGPGDGKSTLASNLAITMAQASQRTLLIDADFRKPMQHNIFSLDVERGLTAMLAGQSAIDNCLQASIVPGLTVLTAGPDVPNPSEMLNSEAFAKLLSQLQEKFDRIIIDSPPVMPVTDARILGALTDITLLVLRAEQSTRKASQQARDGLLSVGATLLGTVVNDVAKKDSRYGYYSGYGSYGYGAYGGRTKPAVPVSTPVS